MNTPAHRRARRMAAQVAHTLEGVRSVALSQSRFGNRPGVASVLSLWPGAGHVLRDQYGYSYGNKFVFEENVQVEVQPGTRMAVVLSWKNILEVGTIVLRNQYGHALELPFSIVVGVTFDQAQVEE